MKKRLVALSLSIAILATMAAGVVIFNDGTPTVVVDGISADTSDSAITISKVGQSTGKRGEYEVTLTVKGEQAKEEDIETTDIVMVLDCTSSMSDALDSKKTKMQAMKDAATEFVNALLGPEKSKAKIAMVVFSELGDAKTYILNTGLTGTNFYTHDTLTQALAAVNSIAVTGTSTGIQFGMEKAIDLFNNSEFEGMKKVCVLLSDGAANRTHKLSANSTITYTPASGADESYFGLYNNSLANYVVEQGSNGPESSTYYSNYPKENMSNFVSFEPTGVNFDMNSTMSGTSSQVYNSKSVKWVNKSTGKTITHSSYGIGMIQATFYTGCQLKSQIDEFYTIGVFKSTTTSGAKSLLQKLATDNDHYFDVSSSDKITDVFRKISENIQQLALNSVITDPMGDDVGMVYTKTDYTNTKSEYDAGNASVYISTGSLTYDKTKDTISWSLGTVMAGETYTMVYKVQIDDGIYGDEIPLNKTATIAYTKPDGTKKTENFVDPVGEVQGVEYQVKYWLQNISDNDYTLDKTDTKVGNVGETTAITADAKTGFTLQTIQQQTIQETGTVVNVYYNRNSYDYKITHSEKNSSPVNVLKTENGSARYGATVLVSKDDTITGFTYSSMDVPSFVIGTDTSKNQGNVYYTRNNYTIQYIVANDDPSEDKTDTYAYGATVTAYTPSTHEGFDFDGWYTDDTYQTKWTAPETMGASNIVVYGRYTKFVTKLKITKSGMKSNESAIFNVKGDGLGTNGIDIIVNGSTGSTTISGLKIGSTYTVTEISGWSWLYGAVSAKSVVASEKNHTYTLSFTNTPKNPTPPWYNGETRKTNVFNLATGK